VKVWIYRGPFQDLYASARDQARLRREAALAAGETVGRGAEERARQARARRTQPPPRETATVAAAAPEQTAAAVDEVRSQEQASAEPAQEGGG
jgi:hypothetical protein